MKTQDKYDTILNDAIREYIRTTGGYMNETEYAKHAIRIINKYANKLREKKNE